MAMLNNQMVTYGGKWSKNGVIPTYVLVVYASLQMLQW